MAITLEPAIPYKVALSGRGHKLKGAFGLCWRKIVLHLVLLGNVELPARTHKSLGSMNSVVLTRISFLIRENGMQTNMFSS